MFKLIILIDSYSKFLISTSGGYYHSMDVIKIKNLFESSNFKVNVLKYSDLNFDYNFNSTIVIYQSSEDNGLFYKRYIEDIIFYLEQKGAIVLPDYKYLKAHHNKGFMELLRKSFKTVELKTINSVYYGNIVDINSNTYDYPLVVKQVSGSGSSGVLLAKNRKELSKVVKKISRGYIFESILRIPIELTKNILTILLNKFYSDKYLTNVNKINKPYIVQNFISNLPGDYKVLYFGGKYYTLYRSNRKKDFRASGSGIFSDVPDLEIEPLLNFAKLVVNEIDFPIIGMDLGFDGNRFHLIEFQMIHLGPLTLERSNYYHINLNGKWVKVCEKSNLEEEYARSIAEFINLKYPNLQ
jgi:glutathione synthase/RimK-type ligase-like ATP-grasp enzyme